MNTRWEDDGLWASDPAAEEVSRMLDAICPHCDRPLYPRCACWQSGYDDDSHDQRTEDVETGIPMRYQRPDDQEWG